MNKQIIKRLVTLTLAFAMVFSLAGSAFADGSHDARLYKNGKFDANNIDAHLSMGDGAIGDAVITYDGTEYTVVIDLEENFKAHGFTASVKDITCSDALSCDVTDEDGNGKNDTLTIKLSSLAQPQLLNINVTVKVWFMPMNAAGDLVIF